MHSLLEKILRNIENAKRVEKNQFGILKKSYRKITKKNVNLKETRTFRKNPVIVEKPCLL